MRQDLGYLSGLALHVRRGMGERPGDRRFPGRPQPAGIELEAYSPYAPGDDLRHLDWNAVGRLDALLVRRFTAEREVVVHILVDLSASMTVPARDDKLGAAKELALALAYVALSANDAVRVALLPGAAPPRVSPVIRQRASVARVRQLLADAGAGGPLALGETLESYARRHPAPGLAIVVSDLMMDPADVERGLYALRARRYQVLLLHVVGPGELEPGREFSRGLLEDVESGATRPVVLTPAVLARYREMLDQHLRALEALAERSETAYARLVSDASVAEFVTVELPRLGVIRRR
jgi:uncharacterized protein (DUF58 family)